MAGNDESRRWNAMQFCTTHPAVAPNYSVILLNTCDLIAPSAFKDFHSLWQRASIRVCADGGANYLYQASLIMDLLPPDCISGDLDSLQQQAVDNFKGCEISKSDCQDSTDFEKSVLWLEGKAPPALRNLIIIGTLGGRFDQTMAILNTLIKLAVDDRWQVYFLDGGNLVIPLATGKHEIVLHPDKEGPTCGLLPFYVGDAEKFSSDGVNVSTRGLKWDLNETPLKFGGLISTSNQIVIPEEQQGCDRTASVSVEIQVHDEDSVILWTNRVNLDRN